MFYCSIESTSFFCFVDHLCIFILSCQSLTAHKDVWKAIPFGPLPPVFGNGSGLVVYSNISDIFLRGSQRPVLVLGSLLGGYFLLSNCRKHTTEQWICRLKNDKHVTYWAIILNHCFTYFRPTSLIFQTSEFIFTFNTLLIMWQETQLQVTYFCWVSCRIIRRVKTKVKISHCLWCISSWERTKMRTNLLKLHVVL